MLRHRGDMLRARRSGRASACTSAGDDAGAYGGAVVRVHQLHERIGLRERHGLQQHGVDDGEDRDVDADAERQRRDAPSP